MFAFRQTRLSLRRPLVSYSKVQRLLGALLRNRRLQLRRHSLRGKSCLNIGCGDQLHPSLINVDYHWLPGLDLCWDLCRPLPFAAGSMEGVFSEHCLEHFSFVDAGALLADLYRLLAPGGVLRLIVPDAEAFLLAYARWRQGLPFAFPAPYQPVSDSDDFSPIMAVNSVFRDHGHHFAYDFDCLQRLLQQHGFCEVRRCAFRQGRHSVLLIDSPARQAESLVVEAVK